MSSSRQLAAIMFTDIVGYTALMGSNEKKALKLLDKNRQLQKPIIEQFNGKIIKELGDGVLAYFSTVSDSVHAAMKIQEQCCISGDFQLRIGIHQGEVVLVENDIFGDAVNIASRIQAIAEPGSIYISESIFHIVSNKQEITTRYVKQETLKNVKESVKIYEVIFSMPGDINRQPVKELTLSIPEKSIAVLPFVNMSNDPDQEYFSDGMAEEILNSLAHLKDLKVAGRTSTFQFKGKNIDLRELGEKLKVKSVLEGSIRKQGNKIRITAQLINAEDGYHLWSERYDRELDDIFAIQDEIALAITEKLEVLLLKKDRDLITQAYTQNTKAYELYLKGRYEWSRRTKEGFLKSIDYYNQAISADPRYSLAYAGMADSYTLLCGYHILSPESSIANAKPAADTAMQLNTALAEAYEATGHIELLAGINWQKAADDYRRALQLNPSFATARQRYALMLATQGKYSEAVKEIKKAQELDPLSKIINTDAGLIQLLMGNAANAIGQCQQVLDIDSAFSVALFVQGLAHEQTGKKDAAVTSFQQSAEASGKNAIAVSALGHAYAISGKKTEALKILNELETSSGQNYVSPYCIAVIHAGLGNTDEVFKWLNKAVDEKSVWMIHLHLGADPRFNEFKTDNRFSALLKRIQFIRE